MPWKNGGGRTAQISRFPHGGDPYLWRLSQAEVCSNGPFSNFPGFDRLLSVWQGQGLWLNQTLLPAQEVLSFAGETEIHARLVAGPILDLGLIYDRARVQARMKHVTLGSSAELVAILAANRFRESATSTQFFFVTEGRLRIGDQIATAADTIQILSDSPKDSAVRQPTEALEPLPITGFLISISFSV